MVRKGSVQLSWRTDDQDISSYRIYRSIEPGVSFSQFYKEIYGSNSYTDTNVDSGKTYYYRITAIDQAGNEGELSIEVYGTALISDVNNTTSGLPISLYGLVDSSLTTIDSLLNDVERLTSTFEEKFSADKILLTDLGFSTEFDSVRSELRALKNDVEKYKSQTITQTELTKKLNAVELKINTLKKRIPEDIIISNRKTITQTLTEDDIRQVIFELNPSIEPNLLSKKLSRSFGAYVDFKFKTESTLSVFDIVYLDGSRSKRSLVHQHITSDLAGNGNVSIAEFIPKEFASNVEDINFKTPGYQVLKSDPIVSFLSDVTDIVYLINSPTDIDLISRIKTLPLYRDQSALESSTITGYLTLINVTSSKYSWIIVLSTLVIGFFGFSYFKLRNLTNRELNIIRNSINHAKNLIHQGNLGSAREIYSNIFNSYQKLPDNYKLAVHPEISELWGLINGA